MDAPFEVVSIEGAAHVAAEVASDADVIMLQTTPGAIVRFEVTLEGQAAHEFLIWMGGRVLQRARTMPVALAPTAP